MNQSDNPLSGNRFVSLLNDRFALTSSQCAILKCTKLSISPDQYEMELRELYKGNNAYDWTTPYYTNGFLAFSVQLNDGAIAHIQSDLEESRLIIMLIPPHFAKDSGIEAIIDDATFSHWDLRNGRPPSAKERHTTYSGTSSKTTTINLSSKVLLTYFTKTPSAHISDIGEFEVYKELEHDVYDSSAESPINEFLRASVKEYLERDSEKSDFQSQIGSPEDSISRVDVLAGWVNTSRVTAVEFEQMTGLAFDTYQRAKELLTSLESRSTQASAEH